ncbi:unnamed protein product [Prorocentrum cordatum]|uniref:Uncharacterized protein n=1 Tax=Prorocentrum cordatum TaxID=2364126 RepID=A0ABN9Q8T2_9DINO|nr:unnamed protein product [Polarella glacialis]
MPPNPQHAITFRLMLSSSASDHIGWGRRWPTWWEADTIGEADAFCLDALKRLDQLSIGSRRGAPPANMIRNVTRELEAANEAVGDQEDVCDVALVHKLEAESEVRVAGPPQRSAKRREEVVEVFMGWQKRAAQQGASRLRALRGESNVLLYRVAFAQDELVRARRERANMGLRPKNVRAARFVARSGPSASTSRVSSSPGARSWSRRSEPFLGTVSSRRRRRGA